MQIDSIFQVTREDLKKVSREFDTFVAKQLGFVRVFVKLYATVNKKARVSRVKCRTSTLRFTLDSNKADTNQESEEGNISTIFHIHVDKRDVILGLAFWVNGEF